MTQSFGIEYYGQAIFTISFATKLFCKKCVLHLFVAQGIVQNFKSGIWAFLLFPSH